MMHRATIETAVTKALLDAGLAWGAAMPAFLDTVASVTDAVMAAEQAPLTDQDLVRGFGVRPDFVVDSPDAVPAPQALADPNYCESDWHDTIHSAGSTCPGCSGAWVRSAAMTALDREMRRQAPPADLREQVRDAMETWLPDGGNSRNYDLATDEVLAAFAERERQAYNAGYAACLDVTRQVPPADRETIKRQLEGFAGRIIKRQAPPADPAARAMSADDALEWLRQRLTEDNFPFFNRHPHHTTSETWAMWAERDVLAEIQAVRDAVRQAPPADPTPYRFDPGQGLGGEPVPPADLREQVLLEAWTDAINEGVSDPAELIRDYLLPVFAERERLLRARIEALRTPEPPADAPIDRAVRGWIVYRNEVLADVLAEIDRHG